ncbi:hypothetical protein MASR1M68_14170 [Elusimicrobiota bacterium]
MNDTMQIIFGIIVLGLVVLFLIFSIIKSLKLEHKKEEQRKKIKEEEEKIKLANEEKIKLEAEEKKNFQMAKELEIRNRLVAYELKPVSEWRTELKAIISELLK